ncbi:MAG: lamin tail domain-containing protein [Spirochaetia bacterium]|nr:lamin tail domain-containing protein [Spirochaetia bacterium]
MKLLNIITFYFVIYLFISCSKSPFGEVLQNGEKIDIYFSFNETNNEPESFYELKQFLINTEDSLICAFSEQPDANIRNEILSLIDKGVSVKLAFDSDFVDINNEEPVSNYITGKNNISIYYGNSGEGTLYYNWCISDNEYIFYLSAPALLTRHELKPEYALKIYSRDTNLIDKLKNEFFFFEEGLFGYQKGLISLLNSFSISDMNFEIYKAPQEKPAQKITEYLVGASESIDIYTTNLEDTSSQNILNIPDILNTLSNQIAINIYFDHTAVYDPLNKITELNSDIIKNHFQSTQSVPGAQLIIIDKDGINPVTILFSGALRSKTDTDDDNLIMIFHDNFISEKLSEFITHAESQSRPLQLNAYHAPLPLNREIVINEILWMGSVNNNGDLYDNDEFIEIYNNSGQTINISRWMFACRKNDGNLTGGPLVFPSGAQLNPNDFFLVSKRSGLLIEYPDYRANMGPYGISGDAIECVLTDGNTAQTTGISAYDINGIKGSIIDKAGDGINSFNSVSNKIYSPLGFNDFLNNSAIKTRRSMERISPNDDGFNLLNWKTNSYSVLENNLVSNSFSGQTFASPKTANSQSSLTPAGSVVINELLYMGSYNNDGTNVSSDEFIELFNTTPETINLSGWMFACSSDAITPGSSNINSFFALPWGSYIEPYDYFVISKYDDSAIVNLNLLESVAITNTFTHCILTDGQGGSSSATPYSIKPFFRGHIIDTAGDASASFLSMGLGENGSVRRSLERMNPYLAGNNMSNWLTNDYILSENIFVAAGFNQKTFASVGVINSVSSY